jgi:hypothetical protein
MVWPVTSSTARNLVAGDVISFYINVGGAGSGCNGVVRMYFGSGTHQGKLTLPLTGSGGGGPIGRPGPPAGLTATANGDGTTTLWWTPPSGTPTADFYRIYRDGQDYTHRVDTAGDPGTGTVTWIDTAPGGTTHVYRVTAASPMLAESDFAGPITR